MRKMETIFVILAITIKGKSGKEKLDRDRKPKNMQEIIEERNERKL